MIGYFPLCENQLTLSEVKELPISSINTLKEVIESYEYIISRIQNCRLYKTYIVIRLNGENVEFVIVIRNPDGSLMLKKCQGTIKIKNCPLSFIEKLEQAKKDKNSWVGGYPAAVIDFPKEIRDYIMERSRSGGSGVKNKLLHWIRSWIKQENSKWKE